MASEGKHERLRRLERENRVLREILVDATYKSKMRELELTGQEIDEGDRRYQREEAEREGRELLRKARGDRRTPG